MVVDRVCCQSYLQREGQQGASARHAKAKQQLAEREKEHRSKMLPTPSLTCHKASKARTHLLRMKVPAMGQWAMSSASAHNNTCMRRSMRHVTASAQSGRFNCTGRGICPVHKCCCELARPLCSQFGIFGYMASNVVGTQTCRLLHCKPSQPSHCALICDGSKCSDAAIPLFD